MSKHTPAPWQVSTWASHMKHAGLPASIYFDDDEDSLEVVVCELDPIEVPKDELEANARLIAAAPDLLRRCKMLVSFIDLLIKTGCVVGADTDSTSLEVEMARKVIKEAEGE